MDERRKRHLQRRLRRAMRLYSTPLQRDLACCAERHYGDAIDPNMPKGDRRRALGSWGISQKELALVSRRLRGTVPPKKRAGRGEIFEARRGPEEARGEANGDHDSTEPVDGDEGVHDEDGGLMAATNEVDDDHAQSDDGGPEAASSAVSTRNQ